MYYELDRRRDGQDSIWSLIDFLFSLQRLFLLLSFRLTVHFGEKTVEKENCSSSISDCDIIHRRRYALR